MNKKTSIKEDCRQKSSEVSFSVLSGITAGGALRGKRSLQDRNHSGYVSGNPDKKTLKR